MPEIVIETRRCWPLSAVSDQVISRDSPGAKSNPFVADGACNTFKLVVKLMETLRALIGLGLVNLKMNSPGSPGGN